MTANQLQVMYFCVVQQKCRGVVGNKILFHYQQQRQNTKQLLLLLKNVYSLEGLLKMFMFLFLNTQIGRAHV